VGSGGTLAGVARGAAAQGREGGAVRSRGLGLYKLYTGQEAGGNSITEGIGQGRITANLEGFTPDDAYKIPDSEALPIVFDLLAEEGLCLGGSSGINVAGAVRMARDMGPGHTIVTILCDYGTRYQSKLFNPEFPAEKGLPIPPWLTGPGRDLPASLRDMIRPSLASDRCLPALRRRSGPARTGGGTRGGCGAQAVDYDAWEAEADAGIENLLEAGTASTSFFENLRATLVDWRARFRAAADRTPRGSRRSRRRSRRWARVPEDGAPSPTRSPNGARTWRIGWPRRASRRSTPAPPSPAPTG
jgi:hypothetical protein